MMIAAKHIYYIFVLSLNAGLIWRVVYGAILGCQDKVKAVVGEKFKFLFWAHGMMAFSVMHILEPQRFAVLCGSIFGTDVLPQSVIAQYLKYGLQSLLALLLWDFGVMHTPSMATNFLINCHHIGLFIALHYGFDVAPQQSSASSITHIRQAQLASCLFGWLWAIHSFGFIVEVLLPIFNMKVEDGQRSHLVDALKHAYSLGTVYWLHQYLNDPSQPGLGYSNYQSWAACIMFIGRYLVNQNYRNVDFLRRVEIPGVMVVFLDHICFQDTYLQRSLAVASSLMLIALTWMLFFVDMPPMPSVYVSPADNLELKLFLDDETKAVMDAMDAKSPQDRAGVITWFDSQKSRVGETKDEMWKTRWPVFRAICEDDSEKLERLLEDNPRLGEEANVDWYDSRPMDWALSINLLSRKCALLLLKKGVNPYLKSNGVSAIETNFGHDLGGSKYFIKRFNEVCVRKSPPARGENWNELSIATRLHVIVTKKI